nr:uncharacterized protein LOC128671934 [Plodia interpunctella]
MMWCNANSNWNSDPIEVRSLKRQLAEVSCRNEFHKHATVHETKPYCYEQGVQVKCEPKTVNRTTQMVYNMTSNSNLYSPFSKVSMCPTCLVAFSLLNGSVKKVMKDEELVTDFNIFSDKSVENNLDYVSRTTSFTSPSYTEEDALYDYSSECVYDDAYRHRSPPGPGRNEVTFVDSCLGYRLPVVHSSETHEVCVDTFINSVRPPYNK